MLEASAPVAENSAVQGGVSVPSELVADTISADAATVGTIADLHFAAGAKRPAYRTKWAWGTGINADSFSSISRGVRIMCVVPFVDGCALPGLRSQPLTLAMHA